MKRVASLYLPNWSIDRLRRAERSHAPPPDGHAPDLAGLCEAAAAEQVLQCDAPKNTGWRPGARWARDGGSSSWAKGGTQVASPRSRPEIEAAIAAIPAHRRPPMREMGRRSEAANHPFKAMPPDEGGAFVGPSAVPAVRYPGEGPRPDKHTRRGSNDPHAAPPGVAAFFDTGRTMAGTIARVCRDEKRDARPVPAADAAPLVTVRKVGSRVELAHVSPAAAAIGLAPGMALTQARAAVPGIDVRDADPDGDRADLERLAIALARRWSPIVAISDADGLFMDLTGVAHLHGGEEAMASRIVRLLERLGVMVRIAVANTAAAAWALARHTDKVLPVRIEGSSEHIAALAPLPVAALRLDEASLVLLRHLGVDTIGELTALPRGPLSRRFGSAIVTRLDQATGRAPEPLDPIVPPARIVVGERFAEPIATADAIAHWLSQLIPKLTTELAAAGLGVRSLIFAAERVDDDVQTIRVGLARPSRDPRHLERLIARRIEEIDPGYGIDALSLHVRRADPLGPEALGRDLAEDSAPDLAPLLDTLTNRVAAGALWRCRPVENDVPERAVVRIAALDPPQRGVAPMKREDVRRLDRRPVDHPWHPRWPRPVRLLHRPEPIDHVLAELPDHPPRRFTWRGVTHRVVRADGPERIVGEWWRRPCERDVVRDYFQVEDETGDRFWLFRRGDGVRSETGDLSWWMHGALG